MVGLTFFAIKQVIVHSTEPMANEMILFRKTGNTLGDKSECGSLSQVGAFTRLLSTLTDKLFNFIYNTLKCIILKSKSLTVW